MASETHSVVQLMQPTPSGMPCNDILQVDRLSVRAHETGRQILSGVSLSARRNEILAVAGESGSGKTTLAHAIMKLLPAAEYETKGRVDFCGRDLLAEDRDGLRALLRSEIRYVFQEPGQSLNPIARIGTQMRLVFDQTGENIERFHALLGLFGLTTHASLLRSYPHELSIGTLQRIVLALALAPQPALLIADEPTSAIDYSLKHMMMEHLRALCAESGMSIIFITHDLPLARRYASRLAVLSSGSLNACA